MKDFNILTMDTYRRQRDLTQNRGRSAPNEGMQMDLVQNANLNQPLGLHKERNGCVANTRANCYN
jgi:hypothetical protein